MKELSGRLWVVLFLSGMLIMLSIIGGITWLIDPYFHYHKPLKNIHYDLDDQRYINDGIAKHFDYNAVITGTSMTENFKTSEFNKLFNAEAIKIPLSGEYYREVNHLVETALNESGNDVKYVVRALDYTSLIKPKDALKYDSTLYPWYLYNDTVFDDVEYLFNKEIFISHIIPSVVGYFKKSPSLTVSFDVYSNWNNKYTFGKGAVSNTYQRVEAAVSAVEFTQQDKEFLIDNIKENVTNVADEHPDTEFYYFFPPYSFWYWDSLIQNGQFEKQLEAERLAIEEILSHPNIKLFSFNTRFSMTCNLNNYKDIVHYGEWINSKILYWMKEGNYQLTKENYERYLSLERHFYKTFDFDTYFRYEKLN